MIKEKQKPVHTVRRGAIEASIWLNEGEFGTRYSVSIGRRYSTEDKEGGTLWKTTHSYHQRDLLTLVDVLKEAHEWLLAKHAAELSESQSTRG
jgi:hypothetical protein